MIVNTCFIVPAVNTYVNAIRDTSYMTSNGLTDRYSGLIGYSIVYGYAILGTLVIYGMLILKKRISKIVSFLIFVIILYIVGVSQLATALISLFISILIFSYFYVRNKRIRLLIIIIISLLFALSIWPEFLQSILKILLNIIQPSSAWYVKILNISNNITKNSSMVLFDKRDLLYKESINTFVKHPIVGAIFYGNNFVVGEHSTFLDMLAEYGIVGTIPFVGFFISSLKYELKKLKTLGARACIISSYTAFFVLFIFKRVFGSYAIHVSVFILSPIFVSWLEKLGRKKVNKVKV
jgi:O-antigen ligase